MPSPQFVSTATGATLTKVTEATNFATYDWGVGLYYLTSASVTTGYAYAATYNNTITTNSTSRLILPYVAPVATATLTRLMRRNQVD